jgi:hypothetical protein
MRWGFSKERISTWADAPCFGCQGLIAKRIAQATMPSARTLKSQMAMNQPIFRNVADGISDTPPPG